MLSLRIPPPDIRRAQRKLGTVFTCATGLLCVATALFGMGGVAFLAPLTR